jgi:hypothetical protein
MALSIRGDFLRLSKFLRERFSEKRQGLVLPEATVGNLGGVADGVLGSIRAVGQEYFLEAPAISDS